MTAAWLATAGAGEEAPRDDPPPPPRLCCGPRTDGSGTTISLDDSTIALFLLPAYFLELDPPGITPTGPISGCPWVLGRLTRWSFAIESMGPQRWACVHMCGSLSTRSFVRRLSPPSRARPPRLSREQNTIRPARWKRHTLGAVQGIESDMAAPHVQNHRSHTNPHVAAGGSSFGIRVRWARTHPGGTPRA